MREIKVRAWDKKEKRMIYNVIWRDNWLEGDGFRCEGYDISERFVLMLCSGLEDSNGVCAYDGDIVEYEIIDKEGVGVIKWCDCSCFYGFMLDTLNDSEQILGSPINITILGNLYQNPNLLEK